MYRNTATTSQEISVDFRFFLESTDPNYDPLSKGDDEITFTGKAKITPGYTDYEPDGHRFCVPPDVWITELKMEDFELPVSTVGAKIYRLAHAAALTAFENHMEALHQDPVHEEALA